MFARECVKECARECVRDGVMLGNNGSSKVYLYCKVNIAAFTHCRAITHARNSYSD